MRLPASASFHRFHEARFRGQVDAALSVVRTILDTTRNPRHAAEEEHEYSDKYGLAEFLTNTSIAATLNVLEGLGLDGAKLRELHKYVSADKRSVTLRFEAEETCDFVQVKVVDVEGTHQHVAEAVESTKKGGEASAKNKLTATTTTHKVVTKVTEYHWRVGLEYVVYAYAGSDPQQAHAVVLQRRASSTDIVTTGSKEAPLPSKAKSAPVDASITWLLENISSDGVGTCAFRIDRSVETCRTPRRNHDVSEALSFFHGLKSWSENVKECFVRDVEGKIILGMNRGHATPPSVEPEARTRLHSITDEGVFVPVLPLFEKIESDDDGERGATSGGAASAGAEPRSPALVALSGWDRSPLLSVADVNLFLGEQRRSLDEKVSSYNRFFPSKDSSDIISSAEAIVVLIALHMQSVANHYADGLDYIESMLQTQLIKAIGKEIRESDFAEFVRFHDQKLLRGDVAPKPFSYAIRRPDHYPDGVLSIEKRNGETNDPVMSITKKLDRDASRPMYFPINAATTVEFTGDRYVHAWICHQFAGRQESFYQLSARARQFSSFLLLVGKISGPDGFDPQDAIILQNKDEVIIPLLLNQLPSPKDFKDAISSLSPEQQRFVKAFRSMQLESSVFAVCCVQLKPQLEALLGLPSDALTKEIKLTQDLLSLFIDYQIPSDLLSFDGDGDAPVSDKVSNVRDHVEAVLKVIEDTRNKSLETAQKEADMAFELRQARLLSDESGVASSSFGMGGPPNRCRMMSGRSMAEASASSMQRPRMERDFGSAASASAKMVAEAQPCSFEDTLEFHETPSTPKQAVARDTDGETTERPPTSIEVGPIDFTRIPKLLDAKFEALDGDNALRATVVKTGDTWTKIHRRNMLSKVERTALSADGRKTERDKAFDLLDALSRSGSLPVSCAELHVVVAATHNFDHSLMETIIQDNINPIEKMERSTLIVASTIHGRRLEDILRDELQVSRAKEFSPALFG